MEEEEEEKGGTDGFHISNEQKHPPSSFSPTRNGQSRSEHPPPFPSSFSPSQHRGSVGVSEGVENQFLSLSLVPKSSWNNHLLSLLRSHHRRRRRLQQVCFLPTRSNSSFSSRILPLLLPKILIPTCILRCTFCTTSTTSSISTTTTTSSIIWHQPEEEEEKEGLPAQHGSKTPLDSRLRHRRRCRRLLLLLLSRSFADLIHTSINISQIGHQQRCQQQQWRQQQPPSHC